LLAQQLSTIDLYCMNVSTVSSYKNAAPEVGQYLCEFRAPGSMKISPLRSLIRLFVPGNRSDGRGLSVQQCDIKSNHKSQSDIQTDLSSLKLYQIK
jgi:hypothetical protein